MNKSSSLSGADVAKLLETVQQLARSAEMIAVAAARLADAAAAVAAGDSSAGAAMRRAVGSEASGLPGFEEGVAGEEEPDRGPAAVSGLAWDDYEGLRDRNVGQKNGHKAVSKGHTYNRTAGLMWWKLNFNVDRQGTATPFPAPV